MSLSVREYESLVLLTEEVNEINPNDPNISRKKLNKLGDIFSELKVSELSEANESIIPLLGSAYQELKPIFAKERYFNMSSLFNMLIQFHREQPTATLDAAVDGIIAMHQRIDEDYLYDPEDDDLQRQKARSNRFKLD